MSEVMIIPPRIHWPEPENSGWLNCAMLPWPASTAWVMFRTASRLNPCRFATSCRAWRPAGVSALIFGYSLASGRLRGRECKRVSRTAD